MPLGLARKLANEKFREWFARRRHKDYTIAFSTPEGLRVLADLRRFCLADRTVAGATQEQTHINIGQRNVLLHIQSCMKVEPEELARLAEGAEE